MKLALFSYYHIAISILFHSKEFATSLRDIANKDLVRKAGMFFGLSLFTFNLLLLLSSLVLQIRGVVYPVELAEAFRQAPSMQMKGSLFIPWDLMLYFPLFWACYVFFSAMIHFVSSWVRRKKNRSFVKSLVLMSYASLPLILIGFANNLLFDIWPATLDRNADIFLSQVVLSVLLLFFAWLWKLWIVLSLRKVLFFSDIDNQGNHDSSNNSIPEKPSNKKRKKLTLGYVRKVWRKYRTKLILRLQASIVLFSFISLTLSPTLSLFSQDVVPQSLIGEPYNADAFKQIFEEAENFDTVASWDADIKKAFQRREITRKRAIGMQMERQIAGVKNSDRLHMTSVYQDYLRRLLETKNDELYQTNRFLSDVNINSQRNLFVESLSQKLLTAQEEVTEEKVTQVEAQVEEVQEEPEPEKLIKYFADHVSFGEYIKLSRKKAQFYKRKRKFYSDFVNRRGSFYRVLFNTEAAIKYGEIEKHLHEYSFQEAFQKSKKINISEDYEKENGNYKFSNVLIRTKVAKQLNHSISLRCEEPYKGCKIYLIEID